MSEGKTDSHAGSVEIKGDQSSHGESMTSGGYELNRLGKKSVLRRDFGFVSMMGLACTVMTTWEAVLVLFAVQFANGGYAGSFWGYLLVWLGVLASFTTMAELSSMAPTAGGQYHWTAMLAPRSINKFLSYIVGWLITLAWQAIVASGFFLCATLLQGLIIMGNAAWVAEEWQVPLFYWAFVLLAVFFNTIVSRVLPQVESIVLIMHIFGFLVILIPLVIYGPSNDSSIVFETWINEGMWPTQGLSFMVGLVGPAFGLLGADSAVHMAEEIKSPATNVPRAMAFSVFVNGIMGLGMLIAVLFTLGDPDSILAGPTPYPFMNIFLAAIPNTAGAIVMAVIVFILVICATISFVAAASRLTWAFARDRGMPGWKFISKIEPKTNLPIAAVILTMIVAFILSLIAFGSALAFNDVISLAVAGLYTSYFIGNTLFLYRRIKGDIKPYSAYDSYEIVNVGPEKLAWGPWKVPEPFGTIINAIGCLYLLVMLIFSYFPTAIEPTAATMNWSVFMAGAVGIFAVIYYLAIGKKSYSGPVIDISD